MNKINYITFLILMALVYGCREDEITVQQDDSAPAPAQISDIAVTNLPGGAILKYKLPNDDNLLYVKAEYEIRPGVTQQAKTSYYANTIIVEGFGAEGEYQVKLYSVGRNEKLSEPVIQTIHPLVPSIKTVFDKLDVNSTFGGVRISFENESEANMAVVLLTDTLGNGKWEELQTFYTKSPQGFFSYKGLDTTSAKFAVYLRDRWDNKSDTLTKILKPRFEQEIPKPFGTFNLASDSYLPTEGLPVYTIESLWDGDLNSIFANFHSNLFPQTFTVNLKHSVILSGVRIHQWGGLEYTGSNVRVFELWGSDKDTPDDDLMGGDWIKLGKFESWKPSGPGGTITAEDREYAHIQGEFYEIVSFDENPDPWIPVKYLRFRTLETYKGRSATGQVVIPEISVYGQIINN